MYLSEKYSNVVYNNKNQQNAEVRITIDFQVKDPCCGHF